MTMEMKMPVPDKGSARRSLQQCTHSEKNNYMWLQNTIFILINKITSRFVTAVFLKAVTHN
jgi:hypothetical protein